MIRWDDLRQMSDDGFEIGSHTRTHRRLSEISGHPSLLRDEIEGSAKQIEDRLGVRCDYISWPYGQTRDADATSISMMKESGYRACFGAYRGSVIPAATSRYAIPRHHFELQWPLSHILYFAKGHWERRSCGL
jgi:peptidoglycan/xylan/chitin deacetylase (PgdA/CDA1 family)